MELKDTDKQNHIAIDCSEDINIMENNIEENAYINRNYVANGSLMRRVVNNEDEAYNLYNEYAIRKGFSVRRSKNRYANGKSDKLELRQKEYCCSKSGSKNESDSSSKAHCKFVTKSDCKAMIRFTIENELWTVTYFFDEHNHEFASPSKAYLLRSNRSITAPRANVISSMVNAGIRTRDVFSYMSGEVGGDENLGFPDIVFPDTCHRLCLWHMAKHFPSHLGDLNSNPEFQNFFKKCLYGCESENEFEDTWEKMLEKFNLREHKWLQKLYTLRTKWSLALSKDYFSAGILSTQRSESTNNVLGGFANKTTSLTHFLIAFEKMVAGWRSTEVEEDFQCNYRKPPLSIKNSGIINHAAYVYTHKSFKLFDEEFKYAIGLKWLEVSSLNNVYVFQVIGGEKSKIRHVRLDTSTTEISCSCKKFESSGLLCCHILKILIVKNFDVIPEKYILQRWSKEARKRWIKSESTQVSSDGSKIVYRNNMIRFAYDTILKSQDNEVTRTIVEDGLHKISRDIQVALEKLNMSPNDEEMDGRMIDGQDGLEEINDVDPILNPPRVKPKGVSNARLKGHFEKRKAKPKAEAKNKGKKKACQDINILENSNVSHQNNVLPSTNTVVYPTYNSQYQFSNSTQIPYQVSPHMNVFSQYGAPTPYWNAGVSNFPYAANFIPQNANQMEYFRSLPFTEQGIEPITQLSQDISQQTRRGDPSNKEH